MTSKIIQNLLGAFMAGLLVSTPVFAIWQDDSAGSTSVETREGGNPEKSVQAIDESLLAGMKFRSIGPALMSGRIADIAINPSRPNIWYVAAGSGNLWKTTNSGTSWSPIFDHYGSYSIGCVTVDPTNHETIWVGTGENVAGRHVGYGDGVYVSHDGGSSFENVGLRESQHISKIVVDPANPKIVYVAAQGPLWNDGGERGLYRTADGGKTWTAVLSSGPWTGCTDVVIDPANPNVLYAAMHQRHRTVAALLDTGPESGVYKSTDRGLTWTRLAGGLPGGDMGKIAVAVSPQKSNVVYAAIELPNRKGGFWRSENHGASWSKVSDFVSGGTGPHYYQEIWVDPHRFDCIYHANNTLVRSVDGGQTWDVIEGRYKHVDNHAIAFHPTDPDFVVAGTDGGVYWSRDFATTWEYIQNLPLTQFYKVDVDYDLPFYNIIGGTQDNSTQYGPSRTRYRVGIRSSDWIVPIGGDGHDNAINPDNPDIIYGESQEGYLSRFDRRTGETISIRPAPGAGEPEYRFNWDSPILISPHNSSRLYFASNFLHRSDDHGDTWKTVSPDLTRAENRLGMKMMGRVHGVDAGYDLDAMSVYGSITSISESPVVEGLIYVGTDDGLVQVTEDGGETWRRIDRFFDVPEKAFVNDIKTDRHDADTVYVCLDHHKSGDFKPYLLRSRDRGKTWESMAGDLPERHLVWRFEQDHVDPSIMFLGTEFGLFVSLNAGENWIKMTGGMPNIPVRDIAIQKRENDLVLATFGRSFYVFDDYSPLREIAAAIKGEKAGHLFSPRKALWFQEAGVIPRDSFGDSFFVAENPPSGTVFTVYVRESVETERGKRLEREAGLAKQGKNAELPGWDDLAREAAEKPRQMVIEISDEAGNLINRLSIPSSKGLHRVSWNLRQSSPVAGTPSVLVAPGKYSAQLVVLDGSEVEKSGDAVAVNVEPIFDPAIEPVAREEIVRFQGEVSRLVARLRKVESGFERLKKELAGRKELIQSSAADPATLLESIVKLEEGARSIERLLNGDLEKRSRRVEDVPTVGDRLMTALFRSAGSMHGPTGTVRQQVEIAKPELDSLETVFAEFESSFGGLRSAMEDAGLIWIE